MMTARTAIPINKFRREAKVAAFWVCAILFSQLLFFAGLK
jgi:hypothetical protein